MVLILVFSMFPSSWTAGWVRQCNCRRMGAVCCPAVGLLDGFGSATAEERGRFVARQLDCWMGSAVQLPKNGGGLLPGSWTAGWVRQCNCQRTSGLFPGSWIAGWVRQCNCQRTSGLFPGSWIAGWDCNYRRTRRLFPSSRTAGYSAVQLPKNNSDCRRTRSATLFLNSPDSRRDV